MYPENKSEKSAEPKPTASAKLRSLLTVVKAKLSEALKGDPLTLFAMEGFLALVAFVIDEADVMEAKIMIASMALKEAVRLGDQDQASIRSLNETLRARESDLRLTKEQLTRVQGDYDGLMANLANIQKKPGVHSLGGQDDLSMREAYYMFLGAKINAIKCVRERTGMGLADAKNAVERFVLPAHLANAMDAERKRWGQGCYTMDDRGCNLMCEDLSGKFYAQVGSSHLLLNASTMCASVKPR